MSLLLDSIVTSKYPSFSQASEKELSVLIKDVITHGNYFLKLSKYFKLDVIEPLLIIFRHYLFI